MSKKVEKFDELDVLKSRAVDLVIKSANTTVSDEKEPDERGLETEMERLFGMGEQDKMEGLWGVKGQEKLEESDVQSLSSFEPLTQVDNKS
ncbi:hypothetical protein VL15_35020 [Burkholderia cepacia]|uniref:Uncharacterized protein n=2 Tax=Burkholderia cepacia TaxID=292 RepID=A0A0J5ZA26_BURCE|nr:hypothetical protein VL15_35020 [Burkholderia cepacia]